MLIVFKRLRVSSVSNCKKFNSSSNLIKILKTMPKEQKHISETQKQRIKIKEKLSKYVPGRVTLQVLGTGAQGAPRSLYVFSDQSRYLFNCGEGTQRLAHEHKMKLAKLEHIFITKSSWNNIGGLPGTALTIQDVGVPEITLHGPKGIEELFNATKRFVIIKDLQIKLAECNESTMYEDNVMNVHYVPLFPSKVVEEDVIEEYSNLNKDVQVGSSSNSSVSSDAATSTRNGKHRSRSKSRSPEHLSNIVEDDIDYYAHESKHRHRKRHRSRSRSRTVSRTRKEPAAISTACQIMLNEIKKEAISMAYICRLQPRPGALNLDKCVKNGVPAGPLLGQLKSGQDVTLESGKIVKAQDVCEPDDPGPIFIVVDCPTEDYLPSLLAHDTFKKHQSTAKKDEDLAFLVVHFTPQKVLENQKYKEWMERFTPSTQHLILNDANTCLGSLSVHRIQYKLNLLSNDFFPMLGDTGTQIENDTRIGPVTKKLKTDPNEEVSGKIERLSVDGKPNGSANTFLTYHLRPKKGCDRSDELKITPNTYIEETMSEEGFSEALQNLKRESRERRKALSIRPYPRILFLGTGSCIPNKTRNTSGILLQISETSNILMDCGEGTYGQVVRFFGLQKANEILVHTKAVYISHLHADHHIGLVGFLQGRRKAFEALGIDKQPVYLFAPKQIMSWLQFYDNCFEDVLKEIDIIPNQDLMLENSNLPEVLRQQIFGSLGMSAINTVFVRHCPNAFGVSFVHETGYKITYSGDTMPCDSLVTLGMNSDLLIHEATMEDELSHEAIVKMHSTTSQAIDVGKRMNAKFILLTHFSQRYAKLPRFNDNFTDNIGIAFDNMVVKLDELPLVPLLYPALKLMFAEHYEELEHKAVKRQLRIEKSRAASQERAAAKT